jgi:hypothetical protein
MVEAFAMGTFRSSTVFRLLCAAIGLLSLGLLGMVGVMVYPSLASGDQSSKAQVAKPKVRQLIKAKEVPIDQNLAQLSEFLYPPPKADDIGNIWSRATDSFHDWTLIGLAGEENENKGYVFLQHKPDGKTVVLTVGQGRDLDKLVVGQIHDGMVQISVNGELGALKRSGAIAALPGQPAAPVGPILGGGAAAASSGAATWYGTALPPPTVTPTMPAPPPTSRVTFRGVMAGSPPNGASPAVASAQNATPAAGPGGRQMRVRGGRNGGGGANGAASAPAAPQR